MRHAFRYAGGFEKNFPKLTSATTSFEGSDGQPDAGQTCQNPVLPRDKGNAHAGVRLDTGLGGHIPRAAQVFGQGHADHRIDQEIGQGRNHSAGILRSEWTPASRVRVRWAAPVWGKSLRK